MVTVFREVKRVLRDDGTLWLNLGDSYASSFKGSGGESKKQLSNAGSRYKMNQKLDHGLKPKDLVGIPWRVAFALQADGWYLRSDIIWHKPNPMPESVTDRPTKSHEYIFLLSKSQKYFYDHNAISEKCETPLTSKARCGFGSEKGKCSSMEYSHSNQTGKRWDKTERRNRRSVWTIPTKPFKDAHFAVFPPKLIEPCILAGCPKNGTVLDPFFGSGTTGIVAYKHGRKFIGIDINPKYCAMASGRIRRKTAQLKLFT